MACGPSSAIPILGFPRTDGETRDLLVAAGEQEDLPDIRPRSPGVLDKPITMLGEPTEVRRRSCLRVDRHFARLNPKAHGIRVAKRRCVHECTSSPQKTLCAPMGWSLHCVSFSS
jgi:hypothetical protein